MHSPRSDAAVDYAVALATAFGAPVHLVHVVEEPFMGGEWKTVHPNPQEIRDQRDADARARLADTAGRLETLKNPVSTGSTWLGVRRDRPRGEGGQR